MIISDAKDTDVLEAYLKNYISTVLLNKSCEYVKKPIERKLERYTYREIKRARGE